MELANTDSNADCLREQQDTKLPQTKPASNADGVARLYEPIPLETLATFQNAEKEAGLTTRERNFLAACRELYAEHGRLTALQVQERLSITGRSYYSLKTKTEVSLGMRDHRAARLAESGAQGWTTKVKSSGSAGLASPQAYADDPGILSVIRYAPKTELPHLVGQPNPDQDAAEIKKNFAQYLAKIRKIDPLLDAAIIHYGKSYNTLDDEARRGIDQGFHDRLQLLGVPEKDTLAVMMAIKGIAKRASNSTGRDNTEPAR